MLGSARLDGNRVYEEAVRLRNDASNRRLFRMPNVCEIFTPPQGPCGCVNLLRVDVMSEPHGWWKGRRRWEQKIDLNALWFEVFAFYPAVNGSYGNDVGRERVMMECLLATLTLPVSCCDLFFEIAVRSERGTLLAPENKSQRNIFSRNLIFRSEKTETKQNAKSISECHWHLHASLRLCFRFVVLSCWCSRSSG